MERSKHTVTMPVADYVELEQAVKFIGVQEITKEHNLYNTLKTALETKYRENVNNAIPNDLMDKFTFYVKIHEQKH